MNLASLEKSDWSKLVSMSLGSGDDGPFDNSDHVAVAEPWKWPNALEGVSTADLLAIQRAVSTGRWRENNHAKDWVGKAVASVLKLDITSKAHRSKIGSLIKAWVGTGMLHPPAELEDAFGVASDHEQEVRFDMHQAVPTIVARLTAYVTYWHDFVRVPEGKTFGQLNEIGWEAIAMCAGAIAKRLVGTYEQLHELTGGRTS